MQPPYYWRHEAYARINYPLNKIHMRLCSRVKAYAPHPRLLATTLHDKAPAKA